MVVASLSYLGALSLSLPSENDAGMIGSINQPYVSVLLAFFTLHGLLVGLMWNAQGVWISVKVQELQYVR